MSQELRKNQLTIRIPERVRKAIDAEADREHCSVADVLNKRLAEWYPVPARKERRRR